MGEYAKAEPLYLQTLDIVKKALGEEHPNYASTLNNLAGLYKATGEYAKAEPLYLHARDIRRKALGEKHPDYAINLSDLAELYGLMGEYTKAEKLLLQARDIRKNALGEQHQEYADTLYCLADVYGSMGEYARAERLYIQVRDIRKKVLGERHPDYAATLNNLAAIYHSMKEYGRAEQLYLQAHDIKKKMLGEHHPDYAISAHNLAALYHSMGEYGKAKLLYLQAHEIWKQSLGAQHPTYATSLDGLASLYHSMGDYAKAADFGEQAARAKLDAGLTLFAAVSEAQALNYASKELGPPSLLLSASRRAGTSPDEIYSCVWVGRGLIQQVTAERQRFSYRITTPDVRKLYQAYQDSRRMLSQSILSPAGSDPKQLASRRKRLDELNEEKERLERQLAAELPEFRRQLEAARRPHTELVAHLPPDAVFVDLLRYRYIEQDPKIKGKAGERQTDSYVAFVIRPGKPTARVELGSSAPINEALVRWHDDITKSSDDPTAAAELRRLVWEPLERQFPSETKTVYLCPDDRLTSLPWAALPGRKTGTVLLEEYCLGTVPFGQFLLEQLTTPRSSAEEQGVFLAVGGVSYDSQPVEAGSPPEMFATRDAALGDGHVVWRALPGTGRELETLTKLAGKRRIAKLNGDRACTTTVLSTLPEARWAHFATHGFFADPKFRSALQMDEQVVGPRLGGERRTAAARNPLVLSGLVLAGANLPRARDEYGITRGDGGILTAEAIAALPLDKLELAVLSACDTGVGEVAAGEGVFGLQRAFHLAGARNVVASLWKVDDKPTAALMGLFYHNLWAKKMPPLQALRQAQLQIYHHPESIDTLADSRGLAFDRPTPLPNGGHKKPASTTAPARQWAAFVLSGAGR